MTSLGQEDIVKGKRRPRLWIISTFSLLALLLVVVLWIALAPRATLLARPGGDSEGGPSMSEVENQMRVVSGGQGTISDVRCHRERGEVWGCSVVFAGGRVNLTKAVWHPSQRTLGISIVHRFAQ